MRSSHSQRKVSLRRSSGAEAGKLGSLHFKDRKDALGFKLQAASLSLSTLQGVATGRRYWQLKVVRHTPAREVLVQQVRHMLCRLLVKL